jgi:hypothetical protein
MQNMNQRDHLGKHNMLVVGEETVYLSHLPMFMSPHDYQVILAATFTQAGSNVQATYVNDRTQTGTMIYTLGPEPFVLPDIISTDPQHPLLRSFKGTLFRGHLERGGTPILDDVDVTIKQVVYFRKFDPLANDLPQLQYVFFGKAQELFAAHVITRPPDFDQVISLKVAGHTFTDEELGQGVQVIFPGRTNAISDRLQQQQLSGNIQVKGNNASDLVELKVEADVEFYFETGDLESAMA